MAKRDEKSPTPRAKAKRAPAGKSASPKPSKARSSTTRPAKQKATPAGDEAKTARTVRPPKVEAVRHAEETRAPEPAAPVKPAAPAAPGWSWTPTGVRLDLDALTVDAEQAQVESGGLKAVVSLRRGDQVLYTERVNLDWVGGRDKFLRKAARALAQAGVATQLSETLLTEMRTALRTRPEKPPAHPAADRGARSRV